MSPPSASLNVVRIDTEGDARPDTVAARDQLRDLAGDWRLFPTTPDLAVFVRHGLHAITDQAFPRAALAGDLSALSAADIVNFLAQTRSTGVLFSRCDAVERTLSFHEGKLCWGTSSATPERLGEVAWRFGFITREALDTASSTLEGDTAGRRLGQVLVDTGVMNGHDLFRAIQVQIGEICHALMGARTGSFVFIDTKTDPSLESHVALDTQGVLLEGVRRADEWAYFRKRLPSGELVPRPSGRTAPENLGPNERTVLPLVNGRRTIVEIGMASCLGEFEATKSVHRLLEGELVLVDGPRGEISSTQATPEVSAIVERYDAALLEVSRVLTEAWLDGPYRISLDAFLQAEQKQRPLLAGLALDHGGALPQGPLLQNVARADADTAPAKLVEALEVVLDFALFQARNILDGGTADTVTRRARELARG